MLGFKDHKGFLKHLYISNEDKSFWWAGGGGDLGMANFVFLFKKIPFFCVFKAITASWVHCAALSKANRIKLRYFLHVARCK